MVSDHDKSLESLLYDLGQHAALKPIQAAQQVCAYEAKRIQAHNAPGILEHTLRLQELGSERAAIDTLFGQHAVTSPQDSPVRAAVYVFFIAFLTALGTVLAHMTFSAFGARTAASWLAGCSLAILGMVAGLLFLQSYDNPRLIGRLALSAFVTGLIGQIVFGLIRGHIFLFQLGVAVAATTAADTTRDAVEFYRSAGPLFEVSSLLFSVSAELCTALLFHALWRLKLSKTDKDRAAVLRAQNINDSIEHAKTVAELENEPVVRAAEFMLEFEKGFHAAVRDTSRSVALFSALLLALLPRCHAQPAAAEPVGAAFFEGLDLSGSMAPVGFGGTSQYAACVNALAGAIENLPPGGRVTVVGITNESFAKPGVLLSAAIPADKGRLEFLDQIEIAKRRISSQLRQRAARARPDAPRSDILGFFVYAGALLREQPQSRKVLMVCSDMRQNANAINLERPQTIDAGQALQAAEKQRLVADLKGVDVYIFGVHAAGKTVLYWHSLQTFWAEYFRRCGANLREFSMGYEPPRFAGMPAHAGVGEK